MTLSTKIALVTGGTRGIGQAVAIALGKMGAIVAATATTEDGAAKINEYLKEHGIKGSGYAMNVCDPEAIERVLHSIGVDHGGAPLILVNNAAVTRDNILLRMKADQWNEVIETNLNAVFRVTKACLKPMVKAHWGRIINIASVVAMTGNFGQANYTAAKAGVIAFTKTTAQEVAGYGITANCVAPGFIDTDMTRNLSEKQQELINQKIPMRRVGQPEEIANAVGFLASPLASYITGETLQVNGGMFMG